MTDSRGGSLSGWPNDKFGQHSNRRWFADFFEGVADGGSETSGKIGGQVGHQPVPGLAHFFDGQHHSRNGVFLAD